MAIGLLARTPAVTSRWLAVTKLTITERRAARDSLPPKLRALVPDPDHDAVHALAGSMAKPVMRGHMTSSQAYAALAIEAAKLPDPDALLEAAWQTLRNHVRWRRKIGDDVRRQLADTIKPLIARQAPKNAILAEAHGVNGATGFHLTEGEVNDHAAATVWDALPDAPRKRRYGP